MNIEYSIQAKDLDTDEVIYHRSSFSTEIIEQCIGDAESIVEKYEEREREEKIERIENERIEKEEEEQERKDNED